MESVFGSAHLQCDGFNLRLCVSRAGTRKFTISFYVDGFFKGEWITKDCEERRRFFRPVTRPVFPAKFIRAMAKAVGKKKAQADYSKKVTYYSPCWDSFGALKRHLLKNNKSVRFVSIGTLGSTNGG